MKHAVIVGASSGIGRALARVFAEHDYRVGVMARRVAMLDELRDEIGPAIVVAPIDVAKRSSSFWP